MDAPIPLPDGPLHKRRRILGKQPPPPRGEQARPDTAGPSLTIERSRTSPHLAVMTLTGFPAGQLGLAPLSSLSSAIQTSMSSSMATQMLFKVRVSIEWLVRAGDHDGSTSTYAMTFVPFKTAPESTLGGGSPLRVSELLRTIRRRAQDKMDFVKEHESGLQFERIVKITFAMLPLQRDLRVNPFMNAGGCYKPLPKGLTAKKCCINIQNSDEYCFKYSLIAWAQESWKHLENPNRPNAYLTNAPKGGKRKRDFVPVFVDVPGLDFSMLEFPVKLDAPGLQRFEDANDIGVFAFAWHDDHSGLGYARPIRRPCKVYGREVVLLLHAGHFVLVHRFRALMSLQAMKLGTTSSLHHCHRCLDTFKLEVKLEQHLAAGQCLCDDPPPQEPRLPEPIEGDKLVCVWFKKQDHRWRVPVVVYADFETFQQPTLEAKGLKTNIVSRVSGVASFGYFVESCVPTIASDLHVERGTADEFVIQMLKLGLAYRQACRNPQPMVMTPEDLERFEMQHRCEFCGCSGSNRPLKRDRDHFSGAYRGAACHSCNIKMQAPKNMIVLFHNLEAFDGHEIVLAIMRLRGGPDEEPQEPQVQHEDDSEDEQEETDYTALFDKGMIKKMRFSLLANSSEKYMEIRLGPVCFRDSFKFNTAGLGALIDAQRASRPSLAEAFPRLSARHPFLGRSPGDASLDLLLRKVPMPYSSMTSPEYFSAPPVLERSAYDNDLSGEPCSDEAFAMVRRVVEQFGIQDQGEYHDLYLNTDVLALADCMESMRSGWEAHCGLDMLHSVTLPSASYQAMLKESCVRLELITEENGGMPFMNKLNGNIRGGVSCIMQPFAQANNPRVLRSLPPELDEFSELHAKALTGDDLEWPSLPPAFLAWCKDNGYDHTQPLSWIVYLDANSLYPTTMTMALPIGDYKEERLPENPAERINYVKTLLDLYTDEQAKGYFVEVSYRIPPRLHDLLDYAPVTKREIERSEISEYQRSVLEAIGGGSAKSVKLFPFLGVHSKVLHHAALLKFWLSMGVELFEVHSLWSCRQCRWMKNYITGMAAKRAASDDPVVKDCIKKAMNSLYGKMLQDKSRQCNLTPFTDAVKFTKAASKSRARTYHIVHLDTEDNPYFFGLVETDRRGGPVLDTPRAAGFAILELSKLLMLRAHYGFFKASYGDKARLLFTDTDSLCYSIEAVDAMRDMLASTEVAFDLLTALPEQEFQRIARKYPELPTNLKQRLKEAKGLLGALKLENGSKFIAEYIGLAAKMYSILMIGASGEGETIMKGKGVPSGVLKKQATHAAYKDILLEPAPSEACFRAFRSLKHSLVQVEMTKRMLTAFNDKVYQDSPLISRPLGHWRNASAATEPRSEASVGSGAASSSG